MGVSWQGVGATRYYATSNHAIAVDREVQLLSWWRPGFGRVRGEVPDHGREPRFPPMDLKGFEPFASAMPLRRSTQMSYRPESAISVNKSYDLLTQTQRL